MPVAEANVRTTHAERYLTQLCRHADQMRRLRHHGPRDGAGEVPPEVNGVEHSGTHGCITFGHGRCTLRATPDRLVLLLEAAEDAELGRLERRLGSRLETIGRRDHLTVTWIRGTWIPGPAAEPGPAASRADPLSTRRPRAGTVLLVAAIALAIAVHLGLVAGLLTSPLAGLAADVVLVLVVAKMAVVAALGVHRRRNRHDRGRDTSRAGDPPLRRAP